MHTEDEAKTKWCPWARVLIIARSGRHVDSSPAAYNRIATDDNGKEHTKATLEECCCIASQCAAWRWSDGKHEQRGIACERAEDEKATLALAERLTAEGWLTEDGDTPIHFIEREGFDSIDIIDGFTVYRNRKNRRGYCGLASRGEQ